ncbi:Uma2 family endonuclease [Fulvivirgaceae bacterium PWU20]|uniref:Uma2 family endonuclease n=2 Tax=Chryseosolibacter indicus TaxID=2782351 RepID=A0ABS5VQ53_9BACT|nr:Uma2 family endonuclease [Chryseosolibacter indicus]
MTDEEFFRFCSENPQLRIERNSSQQIIIMSPTTSLTGKYNTEILRQLSNWNIQQKAGEVFDSSTGFTLPDNSVYSPDASWVSKDKWHNLSEDEKNRFAPICPEFIIEVKSKTDHLPDLKAKMKAWLKNGALLGWLIDPVEEIVYVFKPDVKEEIKIEGFDQKVLGEGPVDGFVLDLTLLK